MSARLPPSVYEASHTTLTPLGVQDKLRSFAYRGTVVTYASKPRGAAEAEGEPSQHVTDALLPVLHSTGAAAAAPALAHCVALRARASTEAAEADPAKYALAFLSGAVDDDDDAQRRMRIEHFADHVPVYFMQDAWNALTVHLIAAAAEHAPRHKRELALRLIQFDVLRLPKPLSAHTMRPPHFTTRAAAEWERSAARAALLVRIFDANDAASGESAVVSSLPSAADRSAAQSTHLHAHWLSPVRGNVPWVRLIVRFLTDWQVHEEREYIGEEAPDMRAPCPGVHAHASGTCPGFHMLPLLSEDNQPAARAVRHEPPPQASARWGISAATRAACATGAAPRGALAIALGDYLHEHDVTLRKFLKEFSATARRMDWSAVREAILEARFASMTASYTAFRTMCTAAHERPSTR